MKNHNARPVGSQAVLEAHAIVHKNDSRRGRGKGRGRGQGRGKIPVGFKDVVEVGVIIILIGFRAMEGA